MPQQFFYESKGVRLHGLDSGRRGSGKPFIYIPGISGTAEDGQFFIEAFEDRRVITLSMRGRGQSATPAHGYSIADHGNDIEAAIRHLDLKPRGFHLHGYSIGAMYTLAFLNATELRPTSLILGDHAAQVGKLPKGWAAGFSKMAPIAKIRREALDGIEADSEALSFHESLGSGEVSTPVLLLRGDTTVQPPSPVVDDDVASYRTMFPSFSIKAFPGAGHFLRDTQRDAYLAAIHSFIKAFDA